jgi:hypothetical protein
MLTNIVAWSVFVVAATAVSFWFWLACVWLYDYALELAYRRDLRRWRDANVDDVTHHVDGL